MSLEDDDTAEIFLVTHDSGVILIVYGDEISVDKTCCALVAEIHKEHRSNLLYRPLQTVRDLMLAGF